MSDDDNDNDDDDNGKSIRVQKRQHLKAYKERQVHTQLWFSLPPTTVAQYVLETFGMRRRTEQFKYPTKESIPCFR